MEEARSEARVLVVEVCETRSIPVFSMAELRSGSLLRDDHQGRLKGRGGGVAGSHLASSLLLNLTPRLDFAKVLGNFAIINPLLSVSTTFLTFLKASNLSATS